MGYRSERTEGEHGRVTITIYWGDIPKYEVTTEVGTGGGTCIRNLDKLGPDADKAPHLRPLGYLYSDVDEQIAAALCALIAERSAATARRKAAEALRRRTCTLKVHHGKSVDLSCTETYDALSGCECKLVDADDPYGGQFVHIRYKGTWYELSRTDLFDDVCTGHRYVDERDGPLQDHVAWMRDKACFGARLKHYPHGNFFAVVDSLSDG